MRVMADFRVPEADGWQVQAEQILREELAQAGLIAPASPADKSRIMDDMTADMSAQDLANFLVSVRYVARETGGPVASINVLRNGYLRVRLRGHDFGDLQQRGQALVTNVMQRYGPNSAADWRLARCEIRERGGGKGFLFASWLPGLPKFRKFIFEERRGAFIFSLFVVGLTLESVLSFLPASAYQSDWTQLGLRLGAPTLVSSAVLLLERYVQWLDQKAYRLVWSPRPRQAVNQRLTFESY